MFVASNVMLAVCIGLMTIPSSEQVEKDAPLTEGEGDFLVSILKAAFEEISTFVTDPNTPKDHIDKTVIQTIANIGMCTMDVNSIMAKGDKDDDGFWSFEEYANFVTTFEIPSDGTAGTVVCKNPMDISAGVTIMHENTIAFGVIFMALDKIDGQSNGFITKKNLYQFLKTKSIKEKKVNPEKIFKFIDADGDGKIVKKEFVDYMSKRAVKVKKYMAEVKKEAKLPVKQEKEKENHGRPMARRPVF